MSSPGRFSFSAKSRIRLAEAVLRSSPGFPNRALLRWCSSYLAGRLAADVLRKSKRWDIVTGLLTHSEDAKDHNLPLMDWWG